MGPGIWEFLKELGQSWELCEVVQISRPWFALFVHSAHSAPRWDSQKEECHLLNCHYHFLEQLVILVE